MIVKSYQKKMTAALDEETVNNRYYVNCILQNSKNPGNTAQSRQENLIANVLQNSYSESLGKFSMKYL